MANSGSTNTRRQRSSSQRGRSDRPLPNPTAQIVNELIKINNNIGNQGTRVVSALLKSSRGTSTSAFSDSESFGSDFSQAAMRYYDESLVHQSNSSSNIEEIRVNLVNYINKMMEIEVERDKKDDEREKEEDAKTRRDDQMDDARRREEIRRSQVRDKSFLESLKGIYTNTLAPMFQAGFSALTNEIANIANGLNEGYRNQAENYGTKNMSKDKYDKEVNELLKKTNNTIDVKNANEAIKMLMDLGMTVDQAKTKTVKIGGKDMHLFEFLARASDTGLELNMEDLSYAIKTNSLDQYTREAFGQWGARRNQVDKWTIQDADNNLNQMIFDGSGVNLMRNRNKARNLMMAQTKNMHGMHRDAYYEGLQSILNMKDLDSMNPAALSLITGDQKTAQEMFELLRTNKGQNTTKIIELYNKAVNSGNLMKGMKNMDPMMAAEMSKQLGISPRTFNNLASIEAGTFDQKIYQELQNINDNTSDWLKVSKTNNFWTDNQLGKILMNWANKLGLGDIFMKLGMLLNDPTWGGFATGILSFTTASVLPKLIGGVGSLLGQALGLAGRGASGLWSLLLQGLGGLGGVASKGFNFAKEGVFDFLFNQNTVAGLGTAGKVVKYGGAAIGGATMAFDGITAAMDPNQMKMRDDTSGRVSAGLGAALGGKGNGFGDGLASGFMGTVGGALKGAAVGSIFGPVGTAIGGIIGGVAGAVGGENISKFIDGSIDFLVDSWTWISKNFNQIVSDLVQWGKFIFDGFGATFKTMYNVGKLIMFEIPYNTFNSIVEMLNAAGLGLQGMIKNGIGSALTGLMGLIDPIVKLVPGLGDKWEDAKKSVGSFFDGDKDLEAAKEALGKSLEWQKKTVDSAIHAFDPIVEQNKKFVKWTLDAPNRYQGLDPTEKNSYKRDQAQIRKGKTKNAAEQVMANANSSMILPNTGGFEYTDIKQSEDAKYQNDQLTNIKQTGGIQAGLQKKLVSVSSDELPKQSNLLSNLIGDNAKLRSVMSGLSSKLDQLVKNTTPVQYNITNADGSTTTTTVNPQIVDLLKSSVMY